MIQQNSYPMKEWHRENMQKRVVKYVVGLSDDATPYQKKQHKKYGGNIANLSRALILTLDMELLERKSFYFWTRSEMMLTSLMLEIVLAALKD